jgi:hypothetical protein
MYRIKINTLAGPTSYFVAIIGGAEDKDFRVTNHMPCKRFNSLEDANVMIERIQKVIGIQSFYTPYFVDVEGYWNGGI